MFDSGEALISFSSWIVLFSSGIGLDRDINWIINLRGSQRRTRPAPRNCIYPRRGRSEIVSRNCSMHRSAVSRDRGRSNGEKGLLDSARSRYPEEPLVLEPFGNRVSLTVRRDQRMLIHRKRFFVYRFATLLSFLRAHARVYVTDSSSSSL